MRHVLIGGGSGFIGTALTQALTARGDRVTIISRTAGPGRVTWEDVRERGLPACDAVVNLAGKHILDLGRPWNDTYKDEVLRSRVETTQLLVTALNASAEPPEVFISTAGKCFYGTRELSAHDAHPDLDEDSQPMGIDFPAELVAQWEAAADGVDTSRIRHAKVRVGIVLGSVQRRSVLGRLWRIGKDRGVLPMIRLPFCLGLGSVIGRGTQMFPWIHVDDIVGIVLHVMDNPSATGKFNAVAPGIVNNRTFIQAYAKHLHRPVLWAAPEWLVKTIVGEERSSILLRGQLVRPKRTIASGYAFRYPTIESALTDLVEVTV